MDALNPTEAIKIVREFARDLWRFKERRLRKRVARDATSLAFWNDGMLGSLNRIADGTGTAHDLMTIEKKYRHSHKEVAAITRRLRDCRDKVIDLPRGFEIAQNIERLLYNLRMKWPIRRAIADLVESRQFDTPFAQQMAEEIRQNISNFNERLADLHKSLIAEANHTT